MRCKNVYPSVSNFDVTADEIDLTTVMIGSTNPIDQFDKSDLAVLTGLVDVVVNRVDLTQYEALKNRVEVGVISETEVAEWVVSFALSTEYVYDSLVNTIQTREYHTPVSSDKTESPYQNINVKSFVENIQTRIEPGPTCCLKERGLDQIKKENEPIVLPLLNDFFDKFSFNPSICSNVPNPFSEILGTIQEVLGGGNNVTHNQSYSPQIPQIESMIGRVNSFRDQIMSQIDQTAQQMLTNVAGVDGSLMSFFGQNQTIIQPIINHFMKKISDTRSNYSDENIQGIKDDVNKSLDSVMGQYEDILPSVLDYMMLQCCNTAGNLDQAMRKPVEDLQKSTNDFMTTHDTITSQSSLRRQQITALGGRRIPPTSRVQQRFQAVSNYNAGIGSFDENSLVSNGGNVPDSAVDQPIASDSASGNETELLNKITAKGLPGYFRFQPQVQNMGAKSTRKYNANKGNAKHRRHYDPGQNFHKTVNGQTVDAGWKLVKPDVWLCLIRGLDMLRAAGHNVGTVSINSAYRSPYYNHIIVGGATRSQHMAGKALDISKSGMGSPTRFVTYMKKAGFKGIGYYNSFLHFDIGPARSWGKR